MSKNSGIGTALLSVYDKTGLEAFATALAQRGVRLVSTGGTARHLVAAGVQVQPIEQLTGQAEMLGGRVKTLHPKIFGGILARRELATQMDEIQDAGVEALDLVVVNLYPFQATIADPKHTLAGALEQIDIGGVSLLRAAYKNFAGVLVVVDPADYPSVIEAIDAGAGEISLGRRLAHARKAVAHTAAYEAAICNYLSGIEESSRSPEKSQSAESPERPDSSVQLQTTPSISLYPDSLALHFEHLQSLRYGENPHQPAALYAAVGLPSRGLSAARQLQGKELSFNNFLDTDAAWQLAWSLSSPGVAIIKHANPSGAAIGETLALAYTRARATDPLSAFGGIVGLNATVDEPTAVLIAETFIEVVVAPGYSDAAQAVLEAKPNLRLIELGAPDAGFARLPDLRWVSGGLLVQERDQGAGAAGKWEVVSQRQPTPEQEHDMRFVWSVIPPVRSNAIVIGRDGQLLGVGAGQMSRVDSCRFAAWKASEAGHDLTGSAAASDAFFPFPDGVEVLAAAGVQAIVQPGGSKRDPEVIAAADRLDLVLVHTGTRHFRH